MIDYKEQHGEKVHDDVKNQLNCILEKVGLTFSDKIEIELKKRWEQVSLFERIKTVMLSTHNALESSHGHINVEVPRRQIFFHALKKFTMFDFFSYKFTIMHPAIIKEEPNFLPEEFGHISLFFTIRGSNIFSL